MKRQNNSISFKIIFFTITTAAFLSSGVGFSIEQNGTDRDVNNSHCDPDKSVTKGEDDQIDLYNEEVYSKLKKPNYLEGQVIIKLKDNAYLSTIQKDLEISSIEPVFKHLLRLPDRSKSSSGFKKGNRPGFKAEAIRASALKRGLDRVHWIHLPSGVSVKSVLQKYKDDPKIEYIQPNYIYQPDLVPNDPRYSEQYAHQLTQAEDAWDVVTGSTEVTIAVIGTGVDINHPDLNANIWINIDEIPDNGEDDDGNGYIDDIYGWNFEEDNNEPWPEPG